LALTLLAPIVVNIVAFHVFLAPGAGSLVIAFTLLALGIYLAWTERVIFRPFFQSHPAPDSVRRSGAEAHAAT
jgi:hypothetical protein